MSPDQEPKQNKHTGLRIGLAVGVGALGAAGAVTAGKALLDAASRQKAAAIEEEQPEGVAPSSAEALSKQGIIIPEYTAVPATATATATATPPPTEIPATATASPTPEPPKPTPTATPEIPKNPTLITPENFFGIFEPVTVKELIRLSDEQGRNFIPFIFSEVPERIEYNQEFNQWLVTSGAPFAFIASFDGVYSLAGSDNESKQIGFQEPYSDQKPKPFHAKSIDLFTSVKTQIKFSAQPNILIKKGDEIAAFQKIYPAKDYKGRVYPDNTIFFDSSDLLYTGAVFPKVTKQNELTKNNWAITPSGKVAIAFKVDGK